MSGRSVKEFWSGIRKFPDAREASVLPLFALMVVFLIVVGGAAVDVSRTVNAREKLSYAIDAAALSVASRLSTTVMSDNEIKEALADSFRANLSDAEFLDKAIDNLTFSVDSDEGIISVTSSATLDNYFVDIGGALSSFAGPETFAFSTGSQVTYSRFDVELALVLDVTGSMSDEIGDLKEAADSVVNILIPEGTADGKVKMSIIPYSVGVNLGDYAETATDDLSSRCATERAGDEKYTDASYSTEPVGDGSGTYRSQHCSDSEILPLTDDRKALLEAIDDLKTEGYTAGQTGIGWGWYTLSPNWSDLWPSSATPASYDDEDVLKFALIMTDGDFNTYYDLDTLTKKQCKKLKDKGQFKGSCLNGTNDYWREKSSSGLNGESSKRGIELCSKMKANDIEVFAVFFGSNNSSDGAKVMQSCASTGNYYQATSASQLISAFSNIAKKIQQIYVSQ